MPPYFLIYMLTVPHSPFCLHSIISGMHNDKQSSTIPAYQATVIWRLQEQKIEIPSFTCADVDCNRMRMMTVQPLLYTFKLIHQPKLKILVAGGQIQKPDF
ncbi:hypothetical protein ERO13_A11G251200v2 [Gossypium hirsutum]|nr:hypothetical protein ERO13_A11G251200v2 [Gossypium hirsutum]